MKRPVALALAALLFAGAAILGRALGERPGAAEQAIAVRPSPGAGASVEAKPSPSSFSASATPAGNAVPGVEIAPLRSVSGDLVFASRTVSGDGWGTTELWAIPIAAPSDARVVLRYPRDWVSETWPARQLAPDGRRFAFQAVGAYGYHHLVIADLFTGDLRWLPTADSGIHDGQPVWDPAGTRLAFSRKRGGPEPGNARDDGLWVIRADGTGLAQVAPPSGPPTYIYGWTPDGRSIAFAQNVGYRLVDATDGTIVSMEKVVSGDASWRAASPRLVAQGWETTGAGDLRYIFTADDPGGRRTIVLRADSTTEAIGTPRWRPGADEFLYSRGPVLRIGSLSGDERALTAGGASPTWTPDGSAIVYVHLEEVPPPSPTPCPSPPTQGVWICGEGPSAKLVSTELRMVDADGSNDRALYRLSGPGADLNGWCVCAEGLVTRHY